MQTSFYQTLIRHLADLEQEEYKRKARRMFWRDLAEFILKITALGMIIYAGSLWAALGCPDLGGL